MAVGLLTCFGKLFIFYGILQVSAAIPKAHPELMNLLTLNMEITQSIIRNLYIIGLRSLNATS